MKTGTTTTRRWQSLSSARFVLALLLLVPSIVQLWMANHMTMGDDNAATPSDSFFDHIDTTQKPLSTTKGKIPKIFVGIMGDSSRHLGMEYRNRQRELFSIWNDTRLCHLTRALEIQKNNSSNDECQVIYSFIVGGHNASSTELPYNLGTDDRPLTLTSLPIKLPRLKDVFQPDVTILNIRENMNDGKTPTYLHFAVKAARSVGASYIMKCDSDATIRWGALLRFLHLEFPSPSIPTVLGMFRHKAFWKEGKQDETIWQKEWYAGMHLYLAGQLYVMSVNVAERLVEEARKWYTPSSWTAPYFAGHEDHDALSMVQQDVVPPSNLSTTTNIIRWVGITRHATFWEHPVKQAGRWERILNRERSLAKERLEGTRTTPFTSNQFVKSEDITKKERWRPSLVIFFLESPSARIPTEQESYLETWTQRNGGHLDRVCGISQFFDKTRHVDCDLYYVFVMGTNTRRGELLAGFSNISITTDETWELPVKHNIHRGLGLSTLAYLHEKVSNYADDLDYVLLVQARTTFLDVSKWNQLAKAQPAHHHLVVMGQMRDKFQNLNEFGPYKHEHYWYKENDNIHLYLGSDMIGLGSSLVGKILLQATANETLRAEYMEGNLGHDVTTLAYLGPKAILHWIPVTKSMQFW